MVEGDFTEEERVRDLSYLLERMVMDGGFREVAEHIVSLEVRMNKRVDALISSLRNQTLNTASTDNP